MVEGRVLREHRLLERLQLRPRLQSELVDEQVTSRLVGPQCVGLPPAPIEREHQLGVEPFPIGVVADRVRERTDRVDVVAQGKAAVGESFVSGEHELGDPGRRRLGEAELGEVTERLTVLHGQRRRVQLRRVRVVPLRVRQATLANELLEQEDVDGVRVDVEEVAGVLVNDPVAAEQPA